ncbi:hypothetical protein E1B28_013111 [Marasmius oreades]|uniref:Uncharacterized protein n=1 Tax=Marasmius oreades TaxID=181124 RepID=A0A9P7RP82_9AGAR|nr:uncharacterized protein E1B28_013111 [Marasmius oreades]KAG7087132.1 hypothetical protein E1B28_013111 [Marasmius oreades]
MYLRRCRLAGHRYPKLYHRRRHNDSTSFLSLDHSLFVNVLSSALASFSDVISVLAFLLADKRHNFMLVRTTATSLLRPTCFCLFSHTNTQIPLFLVIFAQCAPLPSSYSSPSSPSSFVRRSPFFKFDEPPSRNPISL